MLKKFLDRQTFDWQTWTFFNFERGKQRGVLVSFAYLWTAFVRSQTKLSGWLSVLDSALRRYGGRQESRQEAEHFFNSIKLDFARLRHIGHIVAWVTKSTRTPSSTHSEKYTPVSSKYTLVGVTDGLWGPLLRPRLPSSIFLKLALEAGSAPAALATRAPGSYPAPASVENY